MGVNEFNKEEDGEEVPFNRYDAIERKLHFKEGLKTFSGITTRNKKKAVLVLFLFSLVTAILMSVPMTIVLTADYVYNDNIYDNWVETTCEVVDLGYGEYGMDEYVVTYMVGDEEMQSTIKHGIFDIGNIYGIGDDISCFYNPKKTSELQLVKYISINKNDFGTALYIAPIAFFAAPFVLFFLPALAIYFGCLNCAQNKGVLVDPESLLEEFRESKKENQDLSSARLVNSTLTGTRNYSDFNLQQYKDELIQSIESNSNTNICQKKMPKGMNETIADFIMMINEKESEVLNNEYSKDKIKGIVSAKHGLTYLSIMFYILSVFYLFAFLGFSLGFGFGFLDIDVTGFFLVQGMACSMFIFIAMFHLFFAFCFVVNTYFIIITDKHVFVVQAVHKFSRYPFAIRCSTIDPSAEFQSIIRKQRCLIYNSLTLNAVRNSDDIATICNDILNDNNSFVV
eukprot:TRINITY_DN11801_c0_g1_i1.p1 TRINITY_DN11801_c0_g1~~TRINITY_DN11801_c0_g1_i1.p1  ORF type:complete len:468 (+),score=107.44 TRINITY_DN11801_c0_g1_i1:45-1406(+)